MPPKPFVVNVATLLHSPGARRHEHREGRIEGLKVTESCVPANADVVADLVLESVESGVLASGTVCAPWVGECRRCLTEVRGELCADVRELFEIGAAPDDEDAYPVNGDQIDLEPLAREAVMLELPLAPLCREACRGLCPECGVDLNEEPHEHGATDPRWAALDVLHAPSQEQAH